LIIVPLGKALKV